MLTELEITKLTYPFPRDDHSFLQGYVYISEEAIGERIEKVDPEWRFSIDEMTALGDSVVVRATLTIRGVSRSNIGGNPVQRDKLDKEKSVYNPLPLYTQADNGVNAYKAAATDAYKRCARLFGIGRYLLGAPKEGRQFEEWLNAQTTAAKAALQALTTPKQIDTTTGEITPAPLAVLPKADTPSSATSPASSGGLASTLPTVTVGADGKIPYEELFPVNALNAATPDALFPKVSALFNARKHFDNWWENHGADLAKKTVEEAERWTRAMRWNWDKEVVGSFFERAEDFGLNAQAVLTVLSSFNGHPVAKARDWDGGPVNVALGAIVATVAEFNIPMVEEMSEIHDLDKGTLTAAKLICVEHQKGVA